MAAALLVPAAVIGALELTLRIVGFGFPPEFLVKAPGREAYISNERFGWRFFPPRIARRPVPFSFPVDKPPGTCRVVILGGSAAAGTPNDNYHFGRILQAMLTQAYPGRRFEVLNAALTAANSHVARVIAEECAAHQVDVFVVYMGNNEVVGPYGPGTVFAGFSPSLSAIRASIFLRGTRTGQLAGDLSRWVSGPPSQTAWRGMEMFAENRVPRDHPRLQKVYEHFRANLEDICASARGAGARVVLCTVATNLRDCAPFASLHRAGLSQTDLDAFKALYDAGVALEQAGRHDEAIAQYDKAAAIDDGFAELQFRLARCQMAAGHWQEARNRFRLARDTDALRFRADSQINEVIRTVAAQAGRGVRLLDFAGLLERDSGTPQGIPGDEWFYEHVHLRFEGNHALAAAVFRQVAGILAESGGGPGGAVPEPPGVQRCAELVAWTPWNRFRDNEAITEMACRAPFTAQLDHTADLARKRRYVARLREALSTEALRQTLQTYRAAVRSAPEDPLLRNSFGLFLFENGKCAEAAEHFRVVLRQFPDSAFATGALGAALAGQGLLDEAVEYDRRSLRIWPGRSSVCRNLAKALAKQGKGDEAVKVLREALASGPADALTRVALGEVLAAQGKNQEAIQHYTQAVRLEPSNVDVRAKLVVFLLRQGEFAQAVEHCRAILKVNPDRADVLYNLSMALVRTGQYDAAVDSLGRALRLKPTHTGHRDLGALLSRRGQSAEAIVHFREALRLQPGWLPASADLAWELATAQDPRLRRPDEALRLAASACEQTKGRNARCLDILAAAQAAGGHFADAVRTAERALPLARASADSSLAKGLEARLALYRAGKACVRGSGGR